MAHQEIAAQDHVEWRAPPIQNHILRQRWLTPELDASKLQVIQKDDGGVFICAEKGIAQPNAPFAAGLELPRGVCADRGEGPTRVHEDAPLSPVELSEKKQMILVGAPQFDLLVAQSCEMLWRVRPRKLFRGERPRRDEQEYHSMDRVEGFQEQSCSECSVRSHHLLLQRSGNSGRRAD